ncbi:hypothetical protein AB0876_31890 [Mycobacterium sp. NPDC049093]
MDYGLWLLTDPSGRITLNGWSEARADHTSPDTAARTEHWPTFVLCDNRGQLSDRLHALGLELAPGADLSDLDKCWDVYLRHPDITALRTQLDHERAATAT